MNEENLNQFLQQLRRQQIFSIQLDKLSEGCENLQLFYIVRELKHNRWRARLICYKHVMKAPVRAVGLNPAA